MFSVIVAVPLGVKAAKLADQYAVPVFSALIALTIMSVTCELAHIEDKMAVREVLEFLAFLFGLYLGQNMQKKVKIVVTSVLGSALVPYGAFMAAGLIPIGKDDAVTTATYIGLNLGLFAITLLYQRHQSAKLN